MHSESTSRNNLENNMIVNRVKSQIIMSQQLVDRKTTKNNDAINAADQADKD